MSDNEEELSENELDSLLADLESRASANDGAQSVGEADDDEDLEAFLSRLESEEESGSAGASVKTAERDDELDARFAELDNLQPDDLPAKTDEHKPAKKAKNKEKAKDKAEDGQGDPQGRSRGGRLALRALKVLAFALPVALLTWLVGSFLANWVSAGWLIAIVAGVFALGVPLVVSRYVKRGKYAWWAAGLGLLLTVGLSAPMPDQAGDALSSYGHWPATTVGELAGWDADNALVQLNSSVATMIGGLLYTQEVQPLGPLELGTDHSLYNEELARPASDAAPPPPTE